MNLLPVPSQNLVDAFYQYLAPNLPGGLQTLLASICQIHRGGASSDGFLRDFYNRIYPLLDDNTKTFATMLCNSVAAGTPAATSLAQTGGAPQQGGGQIPPPPANCNNPQWTPNGWVCQITPGGGGGGGCGCGGNKHPPQMPPQLPAPQSPPGNQLPPPTVPMKPTQFFSNGCAVPQCPPPAAGTTPPVTPVTDQRVNVTGGINCLWYDQGLTDCQIRKIKEDEAEGTTTIEATQTAPTVYEFDMPATGVANFICVLGFTATSTDGLTDLTSLVKSITIRQVVMAQEPTGESVLVYYNKKAASGRRLIVTEGRCQCTELCLCQLATLGTRFIIVMDPAVVDTAIDISFDFERVWADNNCMQCMPCGIPLRCAEDLYEPIT